MGSQKKQIISPVRVKQIILLLQKINVVHNNAIEIDQDFLKRLEVVEEALTHTSAQKSINHERLEFLGDAVLRLAASEFIDLNFPNMSVGKRSELRAHLVSDKWLSEVGSELKIETFTIIGRKAAKDPSAKATIQAEITEALIGAIYESWQSLKPIHLWLTPSWIKRSIAIF